MMTTTTTTSTLPYLRCDVGLDVGEY